MFTLQGRRRRLSKQVNEFAIFFSSNLDLCRLNFLCDVLGESLNSRPRFFFLGVLGDDAGLPEDDTLGEVLLLLAGLPPLVSISMERCFAGGWVPVR